MDVIGTAGSLALYSYQTNLKNYGQTTTSGSTGSTSSSTDTGQSAAVLQALASTYAGLTSATNNLFSKPDSLSSLAGSSDLIPLISGIYSASVASGNATIPAEALQASAASVGGVNTSEASILFSSGNGNSGLDGFSSAAIDMKATLALASYANTQKSFADTTIGAAASAAAAKVDTTQAANVQGAIQAAQTITFNTTMNLLA